MEPPPLYDWHKLCRICLKSDLLVSIYSSTFLMRPVDIVNKLNIFKPDDNLPVNQLCQSCLYRLLDAYNLQQMAEASDRRLREYFNVSTDREQCNASHATESSPQSDRDDNFILKPTIIENSDYDNLCDIFEQNVQSNDIDVEIDVSSLTRSEAGDSLSEVYVENFAPRKSYKKCFDMSTEPSGSIDNVPQLAAKKTGIGEASSSRTQAKLHKCSECGKSFKYARYLEAHRRLHTGEKPYKCKICGRCFAHSSNLLLHQRTHTGERHYQCEVCSSLFTTSSNLKEHMLTHLEERDVQCIHCERRFKSMRELRRHEPIHKAVKDIVCSICSKAFNKRSYLNAHIMAVHRCIRRHKCTDCSRKFSSKSNLACHMRTHTGEKPYQCSHCTWKFNQSSALVRHMKKHIKNTGTDCLEHQPQSESLHNSIISNLIQSSTLVDTNDAIISPLEAEPMNYNLLPSIGTMGGHNDVNVALPSAFTEFPKTATLDYSISQQTQTHPLYSYDK